MPVQDPIESLSSCDVKRKEEACLRDAAGSLGTRRAPSGEILSRSLGSIALSGRRPPGPRRDLRALLDEALLQRRQAEQDIIRPAAVAHKADAPGLALEVAQATADLDAELGQQLFAHR